MPLGAGSIISGITRVMMVYRIILSHVQSRIISDSSGSGPRTGSAASTVKISVFWKIPVSRAALME